jgi:hypothetical protein
MAGETLESAEIIRVMSIALAELERAGCLKAGELPLMRRLIEIVVQGAPVEFPLDSFMGGHGWI